MFSDPMCLTEARHGARGKPPPTPGLHLAAKSTRAPVATSNRRKGAIELAYGRIIKVDDSIEPFYLAFSRGLLVTGNHRYDACFEKWKSIF
jgi:hypothetical protein